MTEREIVIGGCRIADDEAAYVIAEIGHNHAGSMEKARDMVETAKVAGASAVKFQTRHPRDVYSKAEYKRRSENPQWMDTMYGRHRELLEPSREEWKWLFEQCYDIGITAFSTPFDFKSADLLAQIGVPAFKIASGDATNIPLIEYVADFGKPMIVSTGGCNERDVTRIYDALTSKNVEFALLQCSCVYPCPPDVMDLNVISTYRKMYPEIVTGLSTHNPDTAPTLAAFTLGGRIFEHHYTNDQSWKGTDNHFSLTPVTMKKLVGDLGSIGQALGNGTKIQRPEEKTYTVERRKKLVAIRNIAKGHVIRRKDIGILCPGDGLAPYEIDSIVGAVALHDIPGDSDLRLSDVEG
jgi:sialic acid synthase